jgi:hypothetical protein
LISAAAEDKGRADHRAEEKSFFHFTDARFLFSLLPMNPEKDKS